MIEKSSSSDNSPKRSVPSIGMMFLIVVLLVAGWWLKQQEERERTASSRLSESTTSESRDSDKSDAKSSSSDIEKSAKESGPKSNAKTSPFEDEPESTSPATPDTNAPSSVKSRQEPDQEAEIAKTRSGSPATAPPGAAGTKKVATPTKSDPTKISNVTIRDEGGRVVYQGPVDLQPTIDRIESNRRLSFRNDGSVFQNRERRLPVKASGYYREWVHPTPMVSGPGAQRIVTGEAGEIYYTHDHYRSFRRIR